MSAGSRSLLLTLAAVGSAYRSHLMEANEIIVHQVTE
jgi:hypothetical protein